MKIGSDVILVKMDEMKENNYDERDREARLYDEQNSRMDRVERIERLNRNQRRTI